MKEQLTKGVFFLLSSPILKKLRIFHLITILIVVMIAFLMIQSYLGIQNIDTLQQVNQRMSNTSLQFMKDINSIKYNLLFLKENYLKRLSNLSDSSSMDYAFKSIDGSLTEIERIAKDTSANTRINELVGDPSKDLIETVKKLKKLAYRANTKEDFLEFEAVLFTANKNIGNIEKQVEETSYNTSTYSKQISKSQKILSRWILILGFLISGVIGILLNLSISWPLREIIKSTRKMAEGDLSENIRPFGCRESYEVVKELVASVGSLRLLIGNINQESEKIAFASANLKIAAQESGRSAEEVAKAMQELAEASSSQSGQVEQTVKTVSSLGEMVREVFTKTSNIANTSEDVATSAVNGQKVTNDVANEVNQIYISTQAIGEVIRELNNTTREIGEITTEISEIADQTSLLSLNASIEAARAGEHGKGFSVVAKETGKLAERSKVAALTISDRTVRMVNRAEHAAQLMEQGILRVAEVKHLAGQATVTFEGIFNQLKGVLEKINEVAKSAKRMSVYNEEVINAVSNIAAISEETMASTEEVSATAEEQSAGAQEVTTQSENLLLISMEIKQNAAIFKV